jgi:hypothetical protein
MSDAHHPSKVWRAGLEALSILQNVDAGDDVVCKTEK